LKILFLDTETTGLDIIQHEIIQVGYIVLDYDGCGDGNILVEKEIKIRPLHLESASMEALKINGFSAYDWKYSEPFERYANHLKEVLEYADLLVGQNLIFDLRFIKQAFSNLNMEYPKFPNYVDTKNMAEFLLKEGTVPSTSMDKLCKHFNITFSGRAHNALADCERTMKIWKILLKSVPQPNKFTFENPYDPYANKAK
jgi:DNA polymerase III epsilon subunit-like protein